MNAFHSLLTKTGLGKDREKFDNFEIFVNGKIAYKNGKFSIPKEFILELEIDSYSDHIRLKLITPLRIKQNNRLLRDKPELKSLLLSIINRASSMKDEGFKRVEHNITYSEISSNITYKNLIKYSNRQQSKMNFDGLVGEIEYKNLDKNSYEILKLGELIGVGKQTVFGLGKIEVIDL